MDAGAHRHGIGADQTNARGQQGMRYGEREERATVTLSSCVCKASMALGAAAIEQSTSALHLVGCRLPRLNAPVIKVGGSGVNFVYGNQRQPSLPTRDARA